MRSENQTRATILPSFLPPPPPPLVYWYYVPASSRARARNRLLPPVMHARTRISISWLSTSPPPTIEHPCRAWGGSLSLSFSFSSLFVHSVLFSRSKSLRTQASVYSFIFIPPEKGDGWVAVCAGFSSICRFDFLPLFVTVVVEVVRRLFLIFLVENFRLDGLFVFVSKWLINKRGLFGEFCCRYGGVKIIAGNPWNSSMWTARATTLQFDVRPLENSLSCEKPLAWSL